MNEILQSGLSGGQLALLFVCIFVALAFEFVNGFHDTANAVATVIYTHTLRPWAAVILSGVCNFFGVFVGGIAVALGILKLLPTELLVSKGTGAGLAMVLALLLGAIVWNVGTWYFGLPSSSSHTMIGAILGVGIANSMMPGHTFGEGVNWTKAQEIGLSLLLSPAFGFGVSFLLLWTLRKTIKSEVLFREPEKDAPPPGPIRALLLLTCSGVSFAHGSNDGQKGVGLMMLILMGLAPAGFALDANATKAQIERTAQAAQTIETVVKGHEEQLAEKADKLEKVKKAEKKLGELREKLTDVTSVAELPKDQRFPVRSAIIVADKAVDEVVKAGLLSEEETKKVASERKALRSTTDYAPTWVLVAIACSLGIGTMIGWKRIVITVGEKIGSTHMTYSQGAVAELVGSTTIALSAWAGLPVSTTHVLSSGVAGTMVAQGSTLQKGTVSRIAMAWLLTLPASMLLSGLFFVVFRLLLV
ncbi:MAG: inorganic phosphate transporter [Polyangiaceae bacterium]